MLRLAKYLKPFIPLIVLAIILLFVQGFADLTLPEYMGKIVNNGIQQGGVETAVPSAVRQSEMDKLTLFMSADDKASVLADYTLVDQNSPDYDRYVTTYPVLATEPIYVLNAVDSTEIDHLNPIMAKAFMAVSGIEQALADPEKAAALAPPGSAFDLSNLPAGTDVFALLGSLPEAMRSPILDAMNARFDVLGDRMIIQSAVGAVKTEYAALGMDVNNLQGDYILKTGLLMLTLSLVSAAASVVVGLLSARTAAGMARDVRRGVFKKVESFSNTEFDTFSTASLITRSTNDVTQLQMVIVMLIRIVCYAPILGIGGIIKATGTDTSMWWIIALAVVILITVIFTLFSIALPKFKIIQSLIDRLNLVVRENLSGMMVVRAFNTQDFEENRFDRANRDLTNTNLFVNRVMVSMMPIMMMVMNGLSLLIIWVGAHQVAESAMQVGDMMAFMQYALQVVMAFLMLSIMFIILPRAWVSADRIADVLETELAIHDPRKPRSFRDGFTGTVEFRNVSFRYPGAEEDVLHEISFKALPGQTTAFIGSTGSGKSTVVNLIPRFFDVTGGAVLVDDIDIRDVTQHDLHEKIGYIPQRATLFTGTIESNLRYADENAAPEALQDAIDIAQATEFISAFPQGVETEVAQGGVNVSGGQRQRLSIARALVKKPPIYIFDDSFSALDFKTDSALRKALKEKTGDSTVLIVTQRVSTIMTAEQIVVLDEGRIVGKGTHTELLETCEVYREIAMSQLNMEELAL
ncbi:MAG: ABC transporter ATP-binding protein [Anaerolineaceae bacterium]|nr:ABC transporter ATP-binding protein [Anaerolineaceae bacterium]